MWKRQYLSLGSGITLIKVTFFQFVVVLNVFSQDAYGGGWQVGFYWKRFLVGRSRNQEKDAFNGVS